jgi:hypothetical protein
MHNRPDDKLIRIGVLYDGGYLQVVSDYYKYHHERRARLSIRGVHEFIEAEVAGEEGVDKRYCHVVDAHYFRGRFSLDDAVAKGKLEGERAFDDVLIRENVVTHYLPRNDARDEKGIDVWLALEAYELAVFKGFNVLVLVACDGDYLPLVRKLNALGTRVMLLAWEFDFTDDFGRRRETRTAQVLLKEATYPIRMNERIDALTAVDDQLINNLFIDASADFAPSAMAGSVSAIDASDPPGRTGHVVELRRDRHFGIIDDGEQTWLFLSTETVSPSFDQLREDDPVRFNLIPNPAKPGQMMAGQVTLIGGSQRHDHDAQFEEDTEDEAGDEELASENEYERDDEPIGSESGR